MLFKKTSKIALSIAILGIMSANAVAQQSVSIERNPLDQTPVSLTFSGSEAVATSQVPQLFAKYLGSNAMIGKNMTVQSVTTTPAGITTTRYAQYYQGIKVAYGGYTVVSKSGVISYMAGNYYNPSTLLNALPALTTAEAFTKALASVNATLYMWQDPTAEAHLKQITGNADTSYLPKGELVWIENFNEQNHDRTLHLAYSFDVYAQKPISRNNIYVDAQTGEILYSESRIKHSTATARTKYSGTLSFQTARVSSTYRLHDSTRGGGVHTMNLHNTTTVGSAVEFTSSTNTWPTASADTQALDAHWGAEMVYDFLYSQLGRRSWNNADGILNQYVHLDVNYDNAYWDGTAMFYGDGSGVAAGGFSPLTSLDVTAHEIGHGVCEATANLIYSGESGGLNEGFSDCWGALVENWANPRETDAVAKKVWFMGEELGAGVPLRRLDSPKLYGCPDTYRGTYWYSTTGCSPTSANDQCGVHTNMGVISKWFYLITSGASGRNDNGNTYTVAGLGWVKAANILYQTELSLPSNATYAVTRTNSINAAITLYGACSAEVQSVTNAWYAAGVGAAYTAGGYVASITGASSVAIGSTITLADSTTGGTWSSSTPSIATVGSTGIVTGVAAGIDTIRYSVTNACGTTTVTKIITVSTTASSDIYTYTNSTTGAPSAVNSGITTYSNLTAIGTTSTTPCAQGFSGISGFTATTFSTTGPCIEVSLTAATGRTINVTGFTAGLRRTSTGPTSARLAYSLDGGTTWVNNGSDYAPLNGSCATSTAGTTLASWTTFSISNPSIKFRIYPYNASASTGTIQVYGLSIIGSVTTTCSTPVVGAIAGATSVCAGSTTTFTDTTIAGTWSSSNSAIATVSSSGVVTGVAAGSATITYTKTNACGTGTATKPITVNAATTAGTLSGSSSTCVSGTTTLSSTVSGGTWTSSSATIATVNATTGVVTGVAVGSATITYTVSGACGTATATRVVTVSATTSAGTLSGVSTVCPSATTTLSSTVSGGTWSSSNTAIATVSTSGVVTGVAAGSATISYAVTSGCGTATATYTITVNASPNAGTLSGISSLCISGTGTITSTATGGTWSSSAATIATVNATGTVTGVAAGSATISYSVTNSCGTASATRAITVSGTPTVAAITGATTVATGSTITLSNTTTGGTWSATNARATISATGVVTGVSAGLDTFKYTLSNSCGSAVATYTVTITAATAADIYTYTSSTTGVPSFVNTRISTYSNLTAVGSGTATPCAAGFSGLTGYTTTTYTTTAAYIQVSLTASTGYTINATGFTAGLRRSSTGPAKARLAYSTDGGTTWINNGTDYAPFNGSCATSASGTTLASWTGFSITASSILFRIYPYSASASTGALQIYGLSIIGFVNATAPKYSQNTGVATHEFSIYPNPNQGMFTISIPENTEGASIFVSDMNGKIVAIKNTLSGVTATEMELNTLSAGIYTVKMIVNGEVLIKQVVLQ